MIFTCENCHKRYSIADDRVSGAKVKIRCRSCGHVTRSQPVASEPRRGASSGGGWFAVLDGKEVGPLSEEKLRGHFASQRANQDTLLWRRGMPQWKRVRELPSLTGLVPAQSTPPKLRAEPKRVKTAQAAPVTAGKPEEVESPHATDGLTWLSMRNLTSRTVVLPGVLVGLSAILFWGMFGSRSPVVPERVRAQVGANPAAQPSTRRASPMANLLLGQKKEASPRSPSVGHRTPAVTIPKAETPAEIDPPRGEPPDPRTADHSEIGSRVPKRLAGSAHDVGEAGLSEKDVARVVGQSQPAFQFCIEQELRKNPTFRGGKVFVTAAVGSSGVVKAVEISRRDIEVSGLGDCLKSKAKRMVFPSFRGGETEVQVPLILTTNLP